MRSSADVVMWAAATWPGYRWSEAVMQRGSFHRVLVLAPDVVARVATGTGRRDRVSREALALSLVAEAGLPLAVPLLLSEVADRDGACGLLTSWVPGRPGIGRPWLEVRAGFEEVLSGLAAVPVDGPVAGLPPVRAWCGGEDWPDLVRTALLPLLSASARSEAAAAMDALAAAETDAPRALVHGDLGPHNVLWQDRAVSGLIDLDHAAIGDPAIDVAPLIGAYGAAAVAEVAGAMVVRRGLIHRATLSLQVAAAAELVGDVALRDHALANVEARTRAGTLWDPDGSAPGRPAAT